jgi:hypothetical protein
MSIVSRESLKTMPSNRANEKLKQSSKTNIAQSSLKDFHIEKKIGKYDKIKFCLGDGAYSQVF